MACFTMIADPGHERVHEGHASRASGGVLRRQWFETFPERSLARELIAAIHDGDVVALRSLGVEE
jgi:hypothetical protein